MKTTKRKIGVIGCGKVGMGFAFATMQSGICDQLVLIDKDMRRAAAEAEDLRHGLCFLPRVTEVYAGDYPDLADADIVLITAGAAQAPGEDRMALLRRNTEVLEEIVGQLLEVHFEGIYLVATNPVDIMARLARQLSGAPARRVIGSGTILDTARLRALVGEFFSLDPKNVHAYVLGEHGESEFVPWSQVSVISKSAVTVCHQHPERFPLASLYELEAKTRNAAAELIEAKGATCYGIATALVRLCDAILSGDNSIFTLSCHTGGAYGLRDIYLGVPAVVDGSGIREIVTLELEADEKEHLRRSAHYLDSMYADIRPQFV